jgi:hypothetical protein
MMLTQRRPFLGAFVLAIFVTGCLGWLFHGAGKPVPWWLYLFVFALMASLIYSLACLLQPNGQRGGRARAFDGIDEVE